MMKTLQFWPICHCHPHRAGGPGSKEEMRFVGNNLETVKSANSWAFCGIERKVPAVAVWPFLNAWPHMTCRVSHYNLGSLRCPTISHVSGEMGNDGEAPEFSQTS